MAAQQHAKKLQNEGRILLAKQAYQTGHFSSIKTAANAFSVPYTTLQNRIRGRVARVDRRANGHKLTENEEDTLEHWILSMDNRGYPPAVKAVKDAATILLQERAGPSATLGVNWVSKYTKRRQALKSSFTRQYDYQRAQCEDPTVIEGWFRLVDNTIKKYGIQIADIYNFDETGFAIGLAGT